MKTRLANIWETLHDSYWFIPTLMVIGSILVVLLLLVLDQKLAISTFQVGNISLIYGGGIESARDLLSDLATAIIAIAGVSFSITIVTLSLASTQYGPRLLRHYMRNTGNQIVLGTFVSTFVYCLLLYCQIPDAGIWDSPPRIAVSFAVILAVISIGVFIYFIHHMSEFIRADVIINAAFHELLHSIERLYPEELGIGNNEIADDLGDQIPADFESNSRAISPPTSAYLQAIESEALMQLACDNELIIRLGCRPGNFVIQNHPVMHVYPGAKASEPLAKKLISTFILGHQRTPEQDVEFAIFELVEIALRALSPSLNDPFTAMACVNRLTAGLYRLQDRHIPSELRCDANHRLRIISPVAGFEELVYAAFDPIRQNGQSQELVMHHLNKSLRTLSDHAPTDMQRKPLLSQLALLDQRE